MVKPLATCLVMLALGGAAALAADGYHLARTLPVGGEGGWDYATLDESGKQLYLPRTSHTQVIDTTSGKVVADIPGDHHSHGVALVPRQGRGFITNGEGGSVQVFDSRRFVSLGAIAAPEDADGVIYDPASDRVLVVCGDPGVLLPMRPDVDPQSGHAEPAVDLGGQPEFLAADGHGKAFANLVNKDQVAVVDTRAMKVLAHWPTAPGKGPVGMAIDPAKGRLYVGCRNQRMVIMSAADGHVLAALPIGRGVDATAFANGTAYASCGDGTLGAIRETTPGHFTAETVKTAPGARTLAVDPRDGTVYLPTADRVPASPRPKPVPGTFRVLMVKK